MPLGRAAARIGAVGDDYPRDAAGADGKKTALYQYSNGRWAAYKHEAATVVAIPEDVYSAVGYTYLLDKNKNVMTTFLAQEFPYADGFDRMGRSTSIYWL